MAARFKGSIIIVAVALLAMAAGAFATGLELKTFSALTNPMELRPGEVGNSFHEIKVPEGPIAVYSFVAEVVKVDANGDIVPALLSEAYLHHHVVTARMTDSSSSSPMKPAPKISRTIGFGSGTESRLTPHNFSHPYAFVTEEGQDTWEANVHIINTGSLSESQAHRCLECPCTSQQFDFDAGTINNQTFKADGCNGQLLLEANSRCSLETYHGGLWCCEHNDLCLEASELPLEMPSTTFSLRYTVQYSDVRPDVRPLYIAGCCDASGDLAEAGAIEYDVPECDAKADPGCVHSLATRQPLGGYNSIYGGKAAYDPEQLVDIVFAVGHQHRGGMGIHLFDDATGESLCESHPRYGTEEGVVGNEKGYIIEMTTCRFDPPLKRRLKDVLRVVALYDSFEAHTGVMSLMYIAIADSSEDGLDGEPVVQMIPLTASDDEELHVPADARALQLGMMPLLGLMLGAAMAVGAALGVAGTYVYMRVMTRTHDEPMYAGLLPNQMISTH